MEAAVLLLVFVFVECALSIWLVARHREYLRRIGKMEDSMKALASVREGVESLPVDNDLINLQKLTSAATPEQLEQAKAILDLLGRGEQ